MVYGQRSTFNHDLSENVAYNNPSFPSYICEGRLSLYPDYTANPHWHEDLEFIVILEGTMTYNINGQLVQLHENDGIFVNSRQLHHGFSMEHEDCDFICILLHPSLLSANLYFVQQYVEPFLRNRSNPFLILDHGTDWHQNILELLQDMFLADAKKPAPFLIQRQFMQIFELLCEHTDSISASTGNAADLDTVKNMILFVQEHYQEKVMLADIARAGSCCKSRCSTLFKTFLRESPMVYLNRYRLKSGCDLLRETNRTITEIALTCGFGGASYFCEAFRRHYKITPREYRGRE